MDFGGRFQIDGNAVSQDLGDRSGVDSALSLLEPYCETRYFCPGGC